MNNETPLAYFITWTIYGVHLQGAVTGWRKRREGEQPPQPLLEAWHADRLNHSIELLNSTVRVAAETACRKHSEHRNWKLWAVNARTTHVHAVVSAREHKGTVVRDQLKANCTRQIRELNKLFIDRPVWAVGGDVEFVWTEDELSSVIDYTLIAQDRKGLELEGNPQCASPSSLSSRVSNRARQPGPAPNGLHGRDHV